MDRNLYRLAKEGHVDVLNYLSQLEIQLTPNGNTALHVAAQFGKKLFVETILQNLPSLLCRTNHKGETALHLAARAGHADVVDALLIGNEAKDMVRMKNDNEDTALHEAVRYEHLDVVKSLVRVDVDFSYPPNKDGETPLYLAVEKGLHEFASEILNTCKSSSPAGPEGTTALHAAVILEDQDLNGRTPLHYAAHYNSVRVVRELLTMDDDKSSSSSSSSKSIVYLFTSKEDGENTALHLAACRGNVDVMELFLSHRPDCFEMVNGKGQNIVHIAAEYEKFEVLKFLKHKHRDYLDILVNQKDHNGNAPIHLLANSRVFLPDLLNHPTEVKLVYNKENMTPWDIRRNINCEIFLLNVLLHEEKGPGPSIRQKLLRMKLEKRNDEVEVEKMEKVSDTNLIVASLIATVAFAAGFTLPGGYNGVGMSVLSGKLAFIAFVITDTVAMMLSCTTLFLSFLVTVANGAKVKPKYFASKAYITTANTFIIGALGSMMIAFVTGLYCVLPFFSSLVITTCALGCVFLSMYGGISVIVLDMSDSQRHLKIKEYIYMHMMLRKMKRSFKQFVRKFVRFMTAACSGLL